MSNHKFINHYYNNLYINIKFIQPLHFYNCHSLNKQISKNYLLIKIQSNSYMKLSIKSTVNTTTPIYTLFEQTKYIYTVGRNICIKDFCQQNYSYMPLSEQTQEVLDMKTSSNRKSVILVERINKDDIYLSIYYFNSERKSIKITNSKMVKKIKIYPGDESSYVNIWINMGQDNHLMQVDTNKMRIKASGFTNQNILSMQNHPFQNNIVSVTGKHFIKIYEIKQDRFQMITDLSKKTIYLRQHNCHCWFDEQFLIVSSAHQILIFKNHQLIQTLSNAFEKNEKITNLIKINKCFLGTSNQGKCFMFMKQDDKFVPYHQCWIHPKQTKNQKLVKSRFKQSQRIETIQINNNEDLIVLRTNSLKFYISKLTDISQETQEEFKSNLSFKQVDMLIGAIDEKNVALCQTKSIGLFVQPKQDCLTIWNFTSNKCLLKKQFQPKYKQDNANILVAGAIHPNGYLIVLAFVDRIKFYHLLLDDIKSYYEANYKRVRALTYNQGGNLLAFYYGKGRNCSIVVLNTITKVQICNLKTDSEILNIVWSKNDELICGCERRYVNIWKCLDGFKQKYQIEIPQKINNVQYDDRTERILVSTNNSIIEIQNYKIINKTKPQIPNFYYIYPFDNKYLITDYLGNIYFSNNFLIPDLQKYPKLMASTGKGHVFYKNNNLIYLSENNSELSVLKWKPTDQKEQVDQYVLVIRSEIQKNLQQIKQLQNSIENYHSDIQNKLQLEKNKFEAIQIEDSNNFRNQLFYFQNNYNILLQQKIQVQKAALLLFEAMEDQQNKKIDQIERGFENKLMIQRNKILNLEQKILEQRLVFNKKLKQLQGKHQQDISIIRQNYEKNYHNSFKEWKQIKHKEFDNKKELESKLYEIEQQNQIMVLNFQVNTDEIINDLKLKLHIAQKNKATSVSMIETLTQSNQNIKKELEESRNMCERNEKKLEQAKNRIVCLQKEINWKDNLIKEKETKIYQYEYKINDLQKSKHVLSFRTTEIRKQLQPKQNQIQKLKKQLFKIQEEFGQSDKRMYQLQQKYQKQVKIVENLKLELVQAKNKLKKNKSIYDQLTQQIYKIINNVDPKFWNPQFVKIYQQYVQNKNYEGVKKKPDENTAEEMNRHLIHLQQSLHQVNISNQRAVKGREKQVIRKFKQNAQLIHDLNQLRKKQKQLEAEIEAKDTEIIKLKKELNQNIKPKRIDSALTGITGVKKTIVNNNLESVESSFRLLNQHRKSEYISSQSRTRTTNRILSANRTRVCKGNNFDPNTISIMQKNKVYELMMQLEGAQNKIIHQDKIIDQLNKKLMILQ